MNIDNNDISAYIDSIENEFALDVFHNNKRGFFLSYSDRQSIKIDILLY